MAPALALALIAVLSGCGQAKKTAPRPNPGAVTQARMEARLRAHGYAVSTYTGIGGAQPHARSFSVTGIDWTSPRSFSVSVFIFSSLADAQARGKYTAGLVGHFPWTNRSKLVGPHLFVATEDTAGGQCTMVNGSLRCQRSTGSVLVGDFNKLIAIAEGH
jgi:hypothetical protein